MRTGVHIERVVARDGAVAVDGLVDGIDADVEVAFARALAAFVVDAVADGTGVAERRLRELVLDLPVHLARIDGRGVFLASFGGALGRVGLRDDELVGRSVPVPVSSSPDGDPVPIDEPLVVDVDVQADDGSRTFTAVLVPQPDGGLVAVSVDATERRHAAARLHERLEHQATHDALTGLPNHALLVAQLEDALRRANRHRTSVGVLFVALDRVKLVTDTLGHRAGDELIVETARRLERVVGDRGTVCRIGGERFVLFWDELDDVSEAVDYARLALNAIDRPYRVAAEEAFLSASIGIAFAVLGLSSAETLISNADVAMERARERGSPRFEVFDAEMRARVDSRRKLEIALRHGIDRDEFELAFQPIVSVDDGAIVGFEALARWNHPLLGQLPPGEFIPVAEDSGLIVPLGELLLAEACDRLAAWQERHPDLFVSVNLSGRQLAQPDLIDVVERCLSRAGAAPGGLHIELTETVLLRDVDAAVRRLELLRRTGVHLSLDDFGTGYSSLSYLTRFPIDVVKIDRSFVSQLGVDERDASIVTMIVGMARTLGLDAVAEGVESETQLGALRDLGCARAQGYLFAKPQPAADAEVML
jgi:diguanylate cyclase (GGDEF)-like protein